VNGLPPQSGYYNPALTSDDLPYHSTRNHGPSQIETTM